MAELNMTVTVGPGGDKLIVQPPRATAGRDTTPDLRWKPGGGVSIQYVGFNDPVGPGEAIGVPAPDPGKPADWIATNLNPEPALFVYNVWAKLSDGRVVSSDPEIENEGQGGAAPNPPPDGGG